ncbi:hypothetical protein MUO14_06045 [Halobacillus shinanisalinarum]|uniref:Uncharacterized protein n=1 Tax=Halobacillus shinanisalinarum TaxID=2932258 RepID=A0ABY4H236_9BACI|nr:hypothetical protein [Halobacillus shinanisalinarum]UOQ94513.1 hypothetical protein MUO14_06045 [Halobacillus shinanisalinarum]
MRLHRFYDYFGFMEGDPIIEEIGIGEYRLITCKENLELYKTHYKNESFICVLKTFSDDTERYLELFKYLVDGKANSSFNDKYYIMDKLRLSPLSLISISKQINIPVSELLKYNYREDKYKPYLDLARKRRFRTCMEDAVMFMKKNHYFKGKTELYILQLILGHGELPKTFTHQTWLLIKNVLEEINQSFDQLNWENQCKVVDEICLGGMSVAIETFEARSQELVEKQERINDNFPMITIKSRKQTPQQNNAHSPRIHT